MRSQPGVEPERNAERDRDHHRQERELERCRHALENHFERRPGIDERIAEVAGERAADKAQILFVNRLIEPECLAGALLLDLVGGGIDEDLDRISDQVQAAEHQQRRDREHEQRLRQPAQHEDSHAHRSLVRPRRGVDLLRRAARHTQTCTDRRAPCR